jgi:hypothetical protein
VFFWTSPTYQNIASSFEAIPPSLSVSVECTTTKNLYIFTAPLPESNAALERVIDVIGLPIFDVIRKLQNVY